MKTEVTISVKLDGTKIYLNGKESVSFKLVDNYMLKTDSEFNPWDELTDYVSAIRYNVERQLFEQTILHLDPTYPINWTQVDTMDVCGVGVYCNLLRCAMAQLREHTLTHFKNNVW